ncbi:MAG TPA: hypothetical protein VGF17_01300, partial [Phytomonospora sp.]
MPRIRVLLTAALTAAALALGACSGGEPAADATTTPPPSPLVAPGAGCADETKGATAVRLGPGETVGGLSFGDGAKAVVLLHQSDGDLCQWVPYAMELAERGYRAL